MGLNARRSHYLRYGLVEPEKNSSVQSKHIKEYDVDQLIKDLTEPSVWKEHIEEDLMKFWNKDSTELQKGLFPTYLTNEGYRLSENSQEWPPEIQAALQNDDTKGLINPEYNYIRAHSRLTYANGIAFHVSGKEDYLKQCKKGVDALLDAIDGNQGMFTVQNKKTGEWGQARGERTSQDLAYGLTGLCMYYFLTHDKTILHHIIQLKDYIFDAYLDKEKGYFTWLPKDNKNNDIEIVAQLDQLYAYMLFVTPSLPEPYQTQWKKDLEEIVYILISRFYSERYQFFWGQDTTSSSQTLGTNHTDFGHSVKTMWVIFRIGVLLKKTDYMLFAQEKIDKILKEAYIEKDQCWGRRFDEHGQMDKDKEWWILAELDQATEILALNDPSYLEYLNHTNSYWFTYMVDHENGEIWHMVDGETNQPVLCYPKAHSWKNALHSFEHALFGYMTSSQIKEKDFSLFYAFVEEEEAKKAEPYLFLANKSNIQFYQELSFLKDRNRVVEITYNSLR